jgi:AcrR family transcriptional regulator
MLGTLRYRDVTVIDVARAAGTSPATFYQYFPDIESALIELTADVAADAAGLKETVGGRGWTGKGGYGNALDLVDAVIALWHRHTAVLRVLNLAASEGDKRFVRIQAKLLGGVVTALADAIGAAAKGATADPQATAAALVTMVNAAAAQPYVFDAWKVKPDELRTSLADLLYWGVTARKPTR